MTATLRAALLSVVVAGLLAACTATGGRPSADPGPVPTLPPPPTSTPPTTAAPTTTTTQIERLGADEFSPCELVPDELAGEPIATSSLSRYLPSTVPSLDLCVGWTEDYSRSIDVGYVAYESMTVDELLADVDDVTALDIGDEAGAGRDAGDYWYAAVSDDVRQLFVRIFDRDEALDVDAVEDLTRSAWEQLPEGPPSGGIELPAECDDIDQSLVQDISGPVVLARGGQADGALSCGYLGEDGDAVLVTLIQAVPAVDSVRTFGERDGWRRLGAGLLATISDTNEEIYVAVDEDTLLYLETVAVDPPPAGSGIDEDRQALLDHLLVFAAFS